MTSTKNYSVKPCPFCGSTNIKYSQKTTTGGYPATKYLRLYFYCTKCHAKGPTVMSEKISTDEKYDVIYNKLDSYKDIYYEEALKAWNSRNENNI